MADAAVTSATQQVAAWSVEFAGRPASDAVTFAFRTRLFDFAANAVGGASSEVASVLWAYANNVSGSVDTLGLGHARAEAAALVYGAAAHTLECDDTHQASSTHPGAVVLAAALALGAELNATLGDVLRASVAGYEVMCRVGEAAGPSAQYARGFHPTATCGPFGAAAASAQLLALSSEQAAVALALAGSFASGSLSFLAGGGWSKPLNAGHAAAGGIAAARLSQLGFEGPSEALTGPHGFLAGHAEAPRLALLEAPTARAPLAIERTSMKMHGCCRYEHGPIDGILQLREQLGFGPEDVRAIRIGMLSTGMPIVGEPLPAKRRPATVAEAQFSMPFGAALAVVLGRVAPADHRRALLADPRIERVMDVVSCHTSDELDAAYPDAWPAHVRILLRDGSEHEARVEHPKGDPANPLTHDELLAKLRSLAPAVPGDQADALSELVFERDLGAVATNEVVDRVASCCRYSRSKGL